MTRIVTAVLLGFTGVLDTASQAEAFGRRQSICCSTPVYYHNPCCAPCPPPCPCPPPICHPHDCVTNTTELILRVFITSGHGSYEMILYPGTTAKFPFVNDGQQRVLSAFTLNNVLIDYFAFSPLAQPADCCTPHDLSKCNCLKIDKSQAATATKGVERRQKGTPPSPPPGKPN